jgi:hypothetical protein
VAAFAVLGRTGPEPGVPVVPTVSEGDASLTPLADPYAYRPDRGEAMAERAAFGVAHPLYANSPGGAEASAARTAGWRSLVESAAERAGVDADRLEGLIFLESAGRSDAVTPNGLEGAVGLTQILAETGRNLLGIRVDPAAARRIGRSIRRAHRGGDRALVERLRGYRKGRCLLRDIADQVAEVQIDPIAPHLLEVLDTTPKPAGVEVIA